MMMNTGLSTTSFNRTNNNNNETFANAAAPYKEAEQQHSIEEIAQSNTFIGGMENTNMIN